MSSKIRIKIRKYSSSGLKNSQLFSVLIFDPEKETLGSLTTQIRDKLQLPSTFKLLMFADGGIIDDIQLLMMDDKLEILSKEQEDELLKNQNDDCNSQKSEENQDNNLNLEDTQMTLLDDEEVVAPLPAVQPSHQSEVKPPPAFTTFLGVFKQQSNSSSQATANQPQNRLNIESLLNNTPQFLLTQQREEKSNQIHDKHSQEVLLKKLQYSASDQAKQLPNSQDNSFSLLCNEILPPLQIVSEYNCSQDAQKYFNIQPQSQQQSQQAFVVPEITQIELKEEDNDSDLIMSDDEENDHSSSFMDQSISDNGEASQISCKIYNLLLMSVLQTQWICRSLVF